MATYSITADYQPSYDYIQSLDGLRACAIAFVLLGHFGLARFVPGGFGVTLFFFISGFLITRLLIAEHKASGTISLYHFYLRRALRLYPALLFMVALSCLFYIWIQHPIKLMEIASALFYFANYYSLIIGYKLVEGSPHAFNVLWSLAVEEHYYLIFPLMFLTLYKKPALFIKVIISLMLFILVWRIALVFIWDVIDNRTYFATDTRADSILYGCLLSLILASQNGAKWIEFCARPSVFITGIMLLLFCFLFRHPLFRETFRYSLQGIGLLIVIPAILFHSRYTLFKKILQTPVLVLLGKLSYSLYLQHWLVIIMTSYFVKEMSFTWYLIALPLTLALAYFSYYHIEKPVLYLRVQYGSHRSTVNA